MLKIIENNKSKRKQKKKYDWCIGSGHKFPTRDTGECFDNWSMAHIEFLINEYGRCPVCNRRFKLRAIKCHDGCCLVPVISKHKTYKKNCFENKEREKK
jgi:hypothetical protein